MPNPDVPFDRSYWVMPGKLLRGTTPVIANPLHLTPSCRLSLIPACAM